jgi:hypothetical protein
MLSLFYLHISSLYYNPVSERILHPQILTTNAGVVELLIKELYVANTS